MEGNAQIYQEESKVGHIAIKWKISYFRFISFNPDFRLQSPVFKMERPQRTTWQLRISKFIEEKRKRNFVFELRRMDFELDAVAVSVNWNLSIRNSRESHMAEMKGNDFFYRKFRVYV